MTVYTIEQYDSVTRELLKVINLESNPFYFIMSDLEKGIEHHILHGLDDVKPGKIVTVSCHFTYTSVSLFRKMPREDYEFALMVALTR